jgi:hypothetical protein
MKVFDKDINFWSVFSDLTIAGPTKELYDSDKSKNKDKSSKLMWTIHLIWKRGSDFFNLPETGPNNKIDLVFEDYYGDKTYYAKNKKQVEALRTFYLNTVETVGERELRGLEEKLKERGEFIRATPYSLGVENERGQMVGGTAKLLDDMIANSEKIWTLYSKALKTLDLEDADVQGKGGSQESLNDAGLI